MHIHIRLNWRFVLKQKDHLWKKGVITRIITPKTIVTFPPFRVFLNSRFLSWPCKTVYIRGWNSDPHIHHFVVIFIIITMKIYTDSLIPDQTSINSVSDLSPNCLPFSQYIDIQIQPHSLKLKYKKTSIIRRQHV